MIKYVSAIVLVACLHSGVHGFFLQPHHPALPSSACRSAGVAIPPAFPSPVSTSRSLTTTPTSLAASTVSYYEGKAFDFSCTPPDALNEIEEDKARAMIDSMTGWDVSVPTSVAPKGTVCVTGVGPRKKGGKLSSGPPVVLLHGFDSSCLEYRRLHPLLDDYLDTFALDILGWGFSQLEGVTDFSAEGKKAYLYGFWKDVLKGKPMVLVGASLGGAVAVDFAHAYPEAVEKLVLIDAQVYIDGVGAMSSFPRPIANLGIKVLKSKALRSYAGKLSYHDPATYSTLDAMNIGRVHTLRPGWEDASVNYMLSGGYSTSSKIASIRIPTLILWGAQDQILDPALYAERFVQDIPQVRLRYIEECGHVCHLEKPVQACDDIVAFVKGEELPVMETCSNAPVVAAAAGGGGGPFAGLQDMVNKGLAGLGIGVGEDPLAKTSIKTGLGIGVGEEPLAKTTIDGTEEPCKSCSGEKVVACGNCDGVGGYETYGRWVQCNCCKGTGLVICRNCYSGDPMDVEGIRQTVQDAAKRLGRIKSDR